MGEYTSDILVGRLKINQFVHYRSPLPSHGAPELSNCFRYNFFPEGVTRV